MKKCIWCVAIHMLFFKRLKKVDSCNYLRAGLQLDGKKKLRLNSEVKNDFEYYCQLLKKLDYTNRQHIHSKLEHSRQIIIFAVNVILIKYMIYSLVDICIRITNCYLYLLLFFIVVVFCIYLFLFAKDSVCELS